MLILRRRPGESLLIGDEVEIEILESGSWGVKVGIRAPRGITILRKELRMVREANCAAARHVEIGELARTFRLFSLTDSHNGEAGR